MLRLPDANGSLVTVTPARSGLLRARAEATSLDLTAARVLLVADLLFRAAELRQTQVLVAWALGDQSDEQVARTASALNIHPPTADSAPPDIRVVADGRAAADDRDAIQLRVAAATGPDGILAAEDLLVVRLALMSYPLQQPADLSDGVLARADETLRQWRRQVAGWAESASKPVPERAAAALRAAFEELDTAGALELLGSLDTDGDVPAGARFETFLLADRVLGLDLARDIGRIS
jgi:hypothetical protein